MSADAPSDGSQPIPAAHSSDLGILQKPAFDPLQPVRVGLGIVIREDDDVAGGLSDALVERMKKPRLLDEDQPELGNLRGIRAEEIDRLLIHPLGDAADLIRWPELRRERIEATR